MMLSVSILASGFLSSVNDAYKIYAGIVTAIGTAAFTFNAVRLLGTGEHNLGKVMSKLLTILFGVAIVAVLPLIVGWGREIGERYAWNPSKYEGSNYLSAYSNAPPVIVDEVQEVTLPPAIEIEDEGRTEVSLYKNDIKDALASLYGMGFWEDVDSSHQIPWENITMLQNGEDKYTLSWGSFSIIDQSWGMFLKMLGDELEAQGYARYDDGNKLPQSQAILNALLADVPDDSLWKNAEVRCHVDLSKLMKVEGDGQFTLFSRRTLNFYGAYTQARLGLTFNAYGEESWSSNSWYGRMNIILDEKNVNGEDVLMLLFQTGLIAKRH